MEVLGNMIHADVVSDLTFINKLMRDAAGKFYYAYGTAQHLKPGGSAVKKSMGLENTLRPMGDTRMMDNMRAGAIRLTNARRIEGVTAGARFITPPGWLYNWSKAVGNSITNREKGGGM